MDKLCFEDIVCSIILPKSVLLRLVEEIYLYPKSYHVVHEGTATWKNKYNTTLESPNNTLNDDLWYRSILRTGNSLSKHPPALNNQCNP